MTNAEKAKLMGFKSLKEVSEMIGKPTATINNWARDYPVLFKATLIGCAEIKRQKKISEIF